MISANANDVEAVAGFIAVVRAETALWRRAEVALRDAGCVAPGTFDLLREIAGLEQCRVQDLAEVMLITVGGASQAVDRAVQNGLAERGPHPTDRRSQTVVLTAAGRNALRDAGTVVADVMRQFARGTYDEVDRATLAHLVPNPHTPGERVSSQGAAL